MVMLFNSIEESAMPHFKGGECDTVSENIENECFKME